MKTMFVRSMFALALCLGIVQGCSSEDDKNPVTDNGKVISEVEIQGIGATLSVDTDKKLKAIVKYSDGTSKEVTDNSDTTWNTSDAAVATVDQTGLVKAVKAGTVKITVTYKGKTGSASFAVTP